MQSRSIFLFDWQPGKVARLDALNFTGVARFDPGSMRLRVSRTCNESPNDAQIDVTVVTLGAKGIPALSQYQGTRLNRTSGPTCSNTARCTMV